MFVESRANIHGRYSARKFPLFWRIS